MEKITLSTASPKNKLPENVMDSKVSFVTRRTQRCRIYHKNNEGVKMLFSANITKINKKRQRTRMVCAERLLTPFNCQFKYLTTTVIYTVGLMYILKYANSKMPSPHGKKIGHLSESIQGGWRMCMWEL